MPKWWNLVDALRSGRSARMGVGVQIPPSALRKERSYQLGYGLIYFDEN